MNDCDRCVHMAAMAAHTINRSYCIALGDMSQVPWEDTPEWQRNSIIDGVKAIMANPAITPAELHALWLDTKVKDGWVFGEIKDVVKKTHPCLVPYDSLPSHHRVKDTIFGAVVRGVLGLSK